MTDSWIFDPRGPDFSKLLGPKPLASKGMGLPGTPGFYLITCGNCLAHVGTSGSLSGRIRTLATLGHHRGSDEVLCAAFCTSQPPQVWWETTGSIEEARKREMEFKRFHGEPPSPSTTYEGCNHGRGLLSELLKAAGSDSWEAGYVEAVFTVGERFDILFKPRFGRLWKEIGMPPGPWSEWIRPDTR